MRHCRNIYTIIVIINIVAILDRKTAYPSVIGRPLQRSNEKLLIFKRTCFLLGFE